MYVICTYDVDEKNCAKVMKVLRRYLFHIQKSVFEGTLTPKQYKELQEQIKQVTNSTDSILFFISYNEKQIYKKSLNETNRPSNILI